MLSYDTWMLVLAAIAALALFPASASAVVDVISFIRSQPRDAGDKPTRKFPARLAILCLISSVSLFSLIFSAHNLIPGRDESKTPTWDDTVFEGEPIGVAWANSGLMAQPKPDGSTGILGFTVLAKNVEPDDTSLNDTYMISGIDGAKLQMKASDISRKSIIDINNLSIIPIGAQFNLEGRLPGGAVSENEFDKEWSVFTVYVKYGDKTLRHTYTREWTNQALASGDPMRGPHISRRQP